VAEAAGRDTATAGPARSPVPAVVLSGAPATGKSTVGRALARALGAAVLDQDTATGPLVDVVAGLLGVSDLDDPRLAGPTRAARYETLTALAEDTLHAGTPVVLVAPFTTERRDPAAWRALEHRLRTAGGAPVLVWLRLDPSVVVQRLRARGAPRDSAKLADAEAYRATVHVAAPSGPHLELDADRPVDLIVRELLGRLPGI
jgi:predicted kinase